MHPGLPCNFTTHGFLDSAFSEHVKGPEDVWIGVGFCEKTTPEHQKHKKTR